MTRKMVLESQAEVIDQVLAKHKIRAKVTGGALLPRHARFELSTHLGERIKGIRGLLDEIALGLGAKEARLDRSANGLAIQVPRSDPKTVSLTRLIEGVKSPGPARPMLGLGDNRVPILANLNSPQVAHVLIAGTTGSGKSSLVRSMIISMALWSTTAELALVLIDPKGTEFNDLDALPHLATDIITDSGHAAHVLEALATAMNTDADRAETTTVIVIDEVADLLMMAGRKATHALTRLTQRGRSAGFHIIAATQKPTAEALGSLIKANFPLRLVGRVTSPEEAKTASGYAGTGAERLAGVGSFIAVTGAGRHSFTAAHAIKAAALIRQAQLVAGPVRQRMIIRPPVDPDSLDRLIDVGRPVWSAWRDGSGGLKRGGLIAMAKVLFGPEATGAGHQHRTIQKIVTALESDALQGVNNRAGLDDPSPGPKSETLQRPLGGSGPGQAGQACGPASGGAIIDQVRLRRPVPHPPTDGTCTSDASNRLRTSVGGLTDLPTHWAPALLRRIPQKQGSGKGSKKNVQR